MGCDGRVTTIGADAVEAGGTAVAGLREEDRRVRAAVRRPARRRRLRTTLLALLAGLAAAAPMLAPAPLAAPAAAAVPVPRYAALLMDATSREVLYANAADQTRHPASLTKMMTLFLTFDALRAGKLGLGDRVVFSRHAASMKPSKLGLAPGRSISVDEAIRLLAVKSANDVAVALAETIGGSEPAFTDMMNAKAQALGMTGTHYANASGLGDSDNITTARDLARLAAALITVHGRYYPYFSQRELVMGGTTYINHNRLLGKTLGLDGIKTGFTVDAGYTLAASAERDGRRLIAIVLGEPSLAARNRDANALLEAGFRVFERRRSGERTTVAANLPTLSHPALRVEAAVEQGSADARTAAPARAKAPAKAPAKASPRASPKRPTKAEAAKPRAKLVATSAKKTAERKTTRRKDAAGKRG